MQRKTGNTKRAIELANKTGAYLVVRSRDEAYRLSQLDNPPKRFPVTYDELINTGMRGSFVRNIVIDTEEDFKDYLLSRVTAGLKIERKTP